MQKYKAGALLYTVLISFIILVILNLFILSVYNNNIYINRILIKDKLNSNIISAVRIEIVSQENDNDIIDKEKTLQVFEDKTSEVKIKNRFFGFYQLLTVSANWQDISDSKTVLLGKNIPEKLRHSIYLSDNNIELVLCGNTNIKGNCYLPKIGVRPGTVNGQNYQNETLINGLIYNSKKKLPKFNDNVYNCILNYQNNIFSDHDSIIYYDLLNKNIIENSFKEKTLVLFSDNPVFIEGKTINGNIIIMSKKAVVINKYAKINDAVIMAPFVKIEKDFCGNCQIIASDSILVEENTVLNYPSIIAVVNTSNIKTNANIKINDNTKIAGDVILYEKNFSNTTSTISFEKNTKLYGYIYCKGFLEIKGEIFGGIYTNNFFSKSNTTVYYNYLLNATVNPFKLSENYAQSVFLSNSTKKGIVKWLN